MAPQPVSRAFALGYSPGVVAAAAMLFAVASGGNSVEDPVCPTSPTATSATDLQWGRASDECRMGGIFDASKASVVAVRLAQEAASADAAGDHKGGEDPVVGSGTVWDIVQHADGALECVVLTNAHVVSPRGGVTRGSSLRVSVGGRDLAAKVAFRDPDVDVAFLNFTIGRGDPARDTVTLRPVPRCGGPPRVGQWVLAVGNPMGLLHTMTHGIVSGIGRSVPGLTGKYMEDVIQTDASLNPGNSGGPVMDLAGCLLGIAFKIKVGGGGGLGLVIPARTLERAAERMFFGKGLRASLGIRSGPPRQRDRWSTKLREAAASGPRLETGARVVVKRDGLAQGGWADGSHAGGGGLVPQVGDSPAAGGVFTAVILDVEFGGIHVAGAAGVAPDGNTSAETCNGAYTWARMHRHRPLYYNQNGATLYIGADGSPNASYVLDDTNETRAYIFKQPRTASEAPAVPQSGVWDSTLTWIQEKPTVTVEPTYVRARILDGPRDGKADGIVARVSADAIDVERSRLASSDFVQQGIDEYFNGVEIFMNKALLVTQASAKVGLRVQRGPDWKWDNQDGGAGGIGRIESVGTGTEEGQCWVRWEESGDRNIYRIGFGRFFDLEIADAAERLMHLWAGDIITHVGDRRVHNSTSIFAELEDLGRGDRIRVTVTSLARWRLQRGEDLRRHSKDDQKKDLFQALAHLAKGVDERVLAALLAQKGIDRRLLALLARDDGSEGDDDHVSEFLRDGLAKTRFTLEVTLSELDSDSDSRNSDHFLAARATARSAVA